MDKISKIMKKDAYVCKATDTVADVIKVLSTEEVAGVPIVDEKGKLAGYVTDGDIMRYISPRKPQVYAWGELAPIVINDEPFEEKIAALLAKPAIEIASRKKIAVGADWSLDEVIDMFRREKVSKVAVEDEDGKIVGVVTESAVIRHILKGIMPSAE